MTEISHTLVRDGKINIDVDTTSIIVLQGTS